MEGMKNLNNFSGTGGGDDPFEEPTCGSSMVKIGGLLLGIKQKGRNEISGTVIAQSHLQNPEVKGRE